MEIGGKQVLVCDCTGTMPLDGKALRTRRIAVERNGEIVPRSAFDCTWLNHGDRVEIVEGVLPGDIVVTNGHYQLQYTTSGGAVAGEAGHDHAH